MPYQILFFRGPKLIGTLVSVGTLEATQQAALVGFKERGAEHLEIIDIDTGAELWSFTEGLSG
jgi:hypothetical protein